jgi:hypothetical protein
LLQKSTKTIYRITAQKRADVLKNRNPAGGKPKISSAGKLSDVIGDFIGTGIDYRGEAGRFPRRSQVPVSLTSPEEKSRIPPTRCLLARRGSGRKDSANGDQRAPGISESDQSFGGAEEARGCQEADHGPEAKARISAAEKASWAKRKRSK